MVDLTSVLITSLQADIMQIMFILYRISLAHVTEIIRYWHLSNILFQQIAARVNTHTQLYFTTNVVAKKTLNIIIKHNLNKLNKRSLN